MSGESIDISILQGLFYSDAPMSSEAARYVLSLKLSDAELEAIRDLPEKANEGDLSDGEREWLLAYINMNDMLIILQMQATRLRGAQH